MTTREQHCLDTTGRAYTWTRWAWARPAHVQVRRSLCTKKQKRTQSRHLTLPGKRKFSFSNGTTLGIFSNTKISDFIVSVCVCVCFLFHFDMFNWLYLFIYFCSFICLIFDFFFWFCLVSLWKREKENHAFRQGRWKGSGGSWGRGKNIIK